ncbi:MAG: formate dehydrogenase accessory sulfurtransferase FdhD [Bacteroidetes bacterium]|nr:formate dehydrogenase accessory sulfurtransferase FdhD [Bacteroidota bacterium]
MSDARKPIKIHRWKDQKFHEVEDTVSVEEPLEIRLAFYQKESKERHQISVTMRTPGNDEELALGFLFTENLISGKEAIESVQRIDSGFRKSQRDNIIQVNLNPGFVPDMDLLSRHFYTTSSCGVCGKTSIELVQSLVETRISPPKLSFRANQISRLPEQLETAQKEFNSTGAIHAASLFDQYGELLALREDVGRHNALDKLIGWALLNGMLPLDQHALLLSGRGSFELLQKASMAGIQVVAAVGAPSSLAIQLAEDAGISLLGFVKKERMNLYTHPERIQE